MEVNILRLKGKIVEAGKTQGDIAAELGMGRDSFGRKIKSKGITFTLKDVYKMAEVIPLTHDEVVDIFLSSNAEDDSAVEKWIL